MTAMCILSTISGLQDKIRLTDTHDSIIRREEKSSPIGTGVKKRDDKSDDDGNRFYEKSGYSERDSQTGNELTIKIGFESTGVGMQLGDLRGKGERIGTIDDLKTADSVISVAQPESNGVEESGDNDDRCHPHRHRIQPPLPVLLPKQRSDRSDGRSTCPALQHWESMIGSPRRMEDEMEKRCCDSSIGNTATMNSKSSQFPSEDDLVPEEYGKNVDIKPASADTGRGGKLKRMALELFDILNSNKRSTTADGSARTIGGSGGGSRRFSNASRIITLYQRFPKHKRRIVAADKVIKPSATAAAKNR